MHVHTLDAWQHSHNFAIDRGHAERRTALVMALTAVMMVVEVIAGMALGSMALLADGWHMATHVAAFGIAVFAYRYARRHTDNPRFTFGTGKVGVLGGFASAVALAVVALVMALESVLRLLEPQAILFNEAIAVAVVGLAVNVVSGLLLHSRADHGHGHVHDDDHSRHHHHQDHNLRAAYLHVLADALTSVFAIVALAAGRVFGWTWLDPVMGLVGAAVIARWSWHLVRDTGHVLLDGTADADTRNAIRRAIIGHDGDDGIADLHVWQVGANHLSAAVSVVTRHSRTPEYYKNRLRDIPRLAHVLVEVNPCHGRPGVGCGSGIAPG